MELEEMDADATSLESFSTDEVTVSVWGAPHDASSFLVQEEGLQRRWQ